jgi:hypothetical protein
MGPPMNAKTIAVGGGSSRFETIFAVAGEGTRAMWPGNTMKRLGNHLLARAFATCAAVTVGAALPQELRI